MFSLNTVVIRDAPPHPRQETDSWENSVSVSAAHTHLHTHTQSAGLPSVSAASLGQSSAGRRIRQCPICSLMAQVRWTRSYVVPSSFFFLLPHSISYFLFFDSPGPPPPPPPSTNSTLFKLFPRSLCLSLSETSSPPPCCWVNVTGRTTALSPPPLLAAQTLHFLFIPFPCSCCF